MPIIIKKKSEIKKKRPGRPRKRGRKRRYKGVSPTARKDPYKVIVLKVAGHAMLKELAEYYGTSMIEINHKLIEVAFKKTLAHYEAKEREKEDDS